MVAFFQMWPEIRDFVIACSKGETVKKACPFDDEDINRFLVQADNSNRYLLVRKAIAIMAICGGNRMDELRRMKLSDVHPVSKGYNVTFHHSKERAQIRPHTFLIPYREANNNNGPCYGSILKTYLETVNDDLQEKVSDDILFYRGTKPSPTKSSQFVQSPVGKNTIADTGKEIASWLGLSDPGRYTGHCFRYEN